MSYTKEDQDQGEEEGCIGVWINDDNGEYKNHNLSSSEQIVSREFNTRSQGKVVENMETGDMDMRDIEDVVPIAPKKIRKSMKKKWSMCFIVSLFSNSLARHLTVAVLKLIIAHAKWMKYEDSHTQITITHATATKNPSKSTLTC